MLEFLLRDQPTRQVVCRNMETYTLFWPNLFSRTVPGARPMCRWAARRGAAVHGGLRLRMTRNGHCRMVATRQIPAGQAIISLPLTLAPSVATNKNIQCAGARPEDSPEELASILARHLHNSHSPYRQYLEFLHDLHNTGDDRYASSTSSHTTSRLADQIDGFYGGNGLRVKGVDNAPFLARASLQTPEQRVEWIRVQAVVRRLEQSVPYFAAQSSAWALSMVLARATVDDNLGLTLFPLIDFCKHSYDPNTNIIVCVSKSESERRGVKWHNASTPCAHLVTSRMVASGETISRLLNTRSVHTLEDREYWQMKYGFVPKVDA